MIKVFAIFHYTLALRSQYVSPYLCKECTVNESYLTLILVIIYALFNI